MRLLHDRRMSPSYPVLDGWKTRSVLEHPAWGNSWSTQSEEKQMPVHRAKDSNGPYYQWGNSGKKYHYESGDEKSRETAKKKAKKQGRAAHASGYDG